MKSNWTHIYEPEPGFVKDLKSVDPNLEVFWDSIFKDWVVVRNGVMNSYEIGHYKKLDNRVLESLYEGDTWRRRKPVEFSEYIEKYNTKLEKDRRSKMREESEEFGRRAYVDYGIREHKTQF